MFGELILNCDLDDDTTIDVLRMLDDGVIKEIIDRGVVEVPRTFMPSATQFAVADDGRFFCLAYSAGMYHILLRRKWFGGVREKRLRRIDQGLSLVVGARLRLHVDPLQKFMGNRAQAFGE